MSSITNTFRVWVSRARTFFRSQSTPQNNAPQNNAPQSNVSQSNAAQSNTAQSNALLQEALAAIADLHTAVAALKSELQELKEQTLPQPLPAGKRPTPRPLPLGKRPTPQPLPLGRGVVTSSLESVDEFSADKSIYSPPSTGGAGGGSTGSGSTGGGSASSRAAVIRFNKQFLAEHYDLRYNVLKKATEFRPKSSADKSISSPPLGGGVGGEASPPLGGGVGGEAFRGGSWLPLTDRDVNRMTVEQLEAGGGSWSYGMKLCLESSAVPAYNPVTAWLQGCPEWDGHDHIGDLARRVPTTYDRWPLFFHRWMLAMVAQAKGMNTMGNSMVPLLIGGQGLRKTTFCRSLLPPELREYFMDDIKMDSAEQVERVLARMWLVCVDEYNAKTPREQAKIKRLLTEKDVQVRRPRSDEYRLVPRLASFIATTNDTTPLPSGDGTRRYLCVEVESTIDLDRPIDYPQLYAQALAELSTDGCRWWFTADDEAEIQRHNLPYQQASPLETLLPSLFAPTTDRQRANLWQVQAVQKVLAEQLRNADVPNLRQLADAMKALRWPQGAACGTRGYYLVRKTPSLTDSTDSTDYSDSMRSPHLRNL